MTMTNRERLLAALAGQPVDRVPIWLLFPYHRLGCYADVRANPCYAEIFEASKTRAIMLNRRSLHAPLFASAVQRRDDQITGAGVMVKRRSLTYRDTTLFSEEYPADGTRPGKRLLHTADDLCALAEFPVNTDEKALAAELDRQLPRYLQERREFPAEYGAMMLDLGEPIAFIYANANLLEYPVWSLTHHDTVKRLLDAFMARLRLIYRYTLEHDLADVYFLVGSEVASPPLVSRATFQQWIVPYAQELIGLIHAYGKKVIQHYHGQIREILPDFLTMQPDGLHTIEAPPVGNCTLAEAFAATQNRLTLIGNIQYDCFRAYRADEMRRAVRDVIAEAAGRRFILSPSAGPYEEVISTQVQQNYLAFLQAGWEYGGR